MWFKWSIFLILLGIFQPKSMICRLRISSTSSAPWHHWDIILNRAPVHSVSRQTFHILFYWIATFYTQKKTTHTRMLNFSISYEKKIAHSIFSVAIFGMHFFHVKLFAFREHIYMCFNLIAKVEMMQYSSMRWIQTAPQKLCNFGYAKQPEQRK